jgi:hypothetical protein
MERKAGIDWGFVLCYMLGMHKKKRLPWGIEVCERQHLDGRCPWWTTWNGEGEKIISDARRPRRPAPPSEGGET